MSGKNGLEGKVQEFFVVGEYDLLNGEGGFLYYNPFTDCFYEEKDYEYLVRQEDYDLLLRKLLFNKK